MVFGSSNRAMGVLAILVLFASPAAGREPAWEFGADGETEGWNALHGVLNMQVRDGTLQLLMDPTDPYLWSGESPLDLPARDYPVLEVKMKSDAWGLLQVYWVTDKSPEWYGPDKKRVSCKLTGDGAWHTYRLRVAQHAAWTSTVTHLRIDPTEGYPGQPTQVQASIDYIRVVRASESCCYLSRPLAETGRNFTLLVRAFNDTAEPVAGAVAELVSMDNAQPVGGDLVQTFPSIPPGRGAFAQWQLVADRTGPAMTRVAVRGLSVEPVVLERNFLVSQPFPTMTSDTGSGAVITDASPAIILGNDKVRAVFVRNSFGFGRCEFQRYDTSLGRWIGLARMRSLSRFVAGRGKLDDHDQDIYATTCELSQRQDEQEVVFLCSVVDASGGRWNCRFAFSVKSADDLIRVRYESIPQEDTCVYRFDGPVLYVGEATQGSQKQAAVFPGLEFLQGEQDSSSLRDFTNDWRFRMAPHPFRVTVGAPAVTTSDGTVALFWDPNFRWAETESGMTAMFASPNRIADFPAWQEAGDNHLVGLFIPSIPRYVPENHGIADEPYVAQAGRPLALEAAVWLAGSTDPTAAISRCIELNGLPEVISPPQGVTVARDHCRNAYLQTLWSPEQRGWKPYAEMGEFVPDAWVEMLLRLDARTANDQTRATLLARADEVAAARHIGPLSGDPTWTKTPYFLGLFDGETLQWLEAEVRDAKATQQPDGSWHYVPLPLPSLFADCPPLGNAADVSVFQTALRAGQLLRWANITGDDQAREAGLRGLRYLASGKQLVPQGAPFEDPAASAYLWSSGLAVEAFLDGYRATGDADLLTDARYWANTGLAFVYLWNLPNVELQRYATIGVFGSSYYDHASWLGRPVQWIGLEYAYALRHFAACDTSFPWIKLADGITASALWQMSHDADKRGLYPDSVEGAGDMAAPGFTVRYGLWIQPDLILKNLLAAEGHDPEISFHQVELDSRKIRITSGARLASVTVNQPHAGDLTLEIHSSPGDTPCTVVAGWGRPLRVVCECRELPEVPTGTSLVTEGWMYDQSRRLVYVKTSFTGPALTLRLFHDAASQ